MKAALSDSPGDPVVHEFLIGIISRNIHVDHVHKHTIGEDVFYLVTARAINRKRDVVDDG